MFGGKRLPILARGAGDVIRVTWREVTKLIDKV